VTDAVCFRCDWQGRRLGRTCPNCGAALFRATDHDLDRADASEETDRSTRDPWHARAGSRVAVLVVVAALAAVAAFELLLAEDPDPGGRPSSAAPAAGGRLVIVSGIGEDASIWVLDLASGGSQQGPRVPSRVVDLVDVSSRVGAIGIERLLPGGQTGVAVLSAVQRDAAPEPVGHGDLVAWSPDGRSVVFATNRPRAGGCPRVRIRLVAVRTREVGWALDDPGFCGPVVSISRSAAATYFTAPSGDRTGVYLTGSVGVPHLMFDDVAMVSASPPGAFLLAPSRTGGMDAAAETVLGWQGVGGPMTVGRGGDPLVIERVLAWSPDGAEVALVGSVGETAGVFRLDAGSGTGVREPELVLRTPDVLDATFGVDGSLFLSRPAEIVVERDGSVSRLPLPDGARDVTGPILWIP
jgi:hypothetical protein